MREQQKIYRDILDSQIKTKAYGGLMNPYYQNNSGSSHNNYNGIRSNNASVNHANNNYASFNAAISNPQEEMLMANINNLNPNLFYNCKLQFLNYFF